MTIPTIMRSLCVRLHSTVRLTTLVTSVVVLAAACGTEDAADPLQPTGPVGRVRFVNLITDPTRNPVDVTLEGVPFGVNLAYTGTTPASLPAPSSALFSAVLAGDRTLVLTRTADPSVTVATLTVNVSADQDHTVFATGGAAGSAVAAFTVVEATPTIPAGQARLRVINMSPTAGALDVFVTAPNADLAAATPAATNLAHRAASAGTAVVPGSYQIRTVPAGTAPAARAGAVSSSITLTGGTALAAGAGRTVVIADAAAGGVPLRSFALSDQ